MDNADLRRKRIYSGESKRDNRTCFRRDRDRILYTPAFRRLAGVTQVVNVATERGYHNRLTHSLKVAQVGRSLAEFLTANTADEVIETAGGLDPDVVEAAALAHDIGHPPFGHAAEEALQNRLDTEHGIFDSFEGNPQSFRIVNNVAIHTTPYGDSHQGLDLTLATLNAIIKYPWRRGTSGKRKQKWGCYDTEEDEFEEVRRLRTPGSDDEAKSLEARMMDWADDVTYAIHDMVDFYRAGLIPLNELGNSSEEREGFIGSFRDEYSEVPESWDAHLFLEEEVQKLGEVAGNVEGNALDTAFKGRSTDFATLGFLTSELIERYLGVGPESNAVSIDPSVEGGLDIASELEHEIKLLKHLTEYYVFDDSALIAQQHGHKQLVQELFDILYDATADDSDYSGLIHSPFNEKVKAINEGEHNHDDIDQETLRARVVADIIASMTEQQALEMYKRVTGQSPGLVTDRIVTF